MMINCNPNQKFKKEIALAVAPTLIALIAQKLLDEVSDYFRRKRDEKLMENETKNEKNKNNCKNCCSKNNCRMCSEEISDEEE